MLLLAFVVLGAAYSRLSCAWLDARDACSVKKAVAIDMAMDTLSWLPVWFAIQGDDWRIAVASIVGSGIGTAIGLRKKVNPRG